MSGSRASALCRRRGRSIFFSSEDAPQQLSQRIVCLEARPGRQGQKARRGRRRGEGGRRPQSRGRGRRRLSSSFRCFPLPPPCQVPRVLPAATRKRRALLRFCRRVEERDAGPGPTRRGGQPPERAGRRARDRGRGRSRARPFFFGLSFVVALLCPSPPPLGDGRGAAGDVGGVDDQEVDGSPRRRFWERGRRRGREWSCCCSSSSFFASVAAVTAVAGIAPGSRFPQFRRCRPSCAP